MRRLVYAWEGEVAGLHDRIRELEAELAKAHSALGQLIADDHRNLVTATKAERDAIEAATRAETIKRCVAAGNEIVKVWREDAQGRVAKDPPRYDEANTSNAHANGAEEVVGAIRALATPAAAEQRHLSTEEQQVLHDALRSATKKLAATGDADAGGMPPQHKGLW